MAIIGIAFGVCAFLVVITVLNSFQNEMKHIISSVNPNIIIFSQNGLNDYENFGEALKSKIGPALKKQSPFIYSESILSFHQQTSAVYIRAIDGEKSASLEQLSPLVTPKNSIHSIYKGASSSTYPIILGKELAENLGAKVGDEVTLIHFQDSHAGVKYIKLLIVGVIHVGISQYDKQYGLMNFSDGQKLFGAPNWASGMEIGLKNPDEALKISDELSKTLPFNIIPWQEIDKDLFNQIERDGTSIKLIVLIISFVAGFNIIITLSLTVIDRSKQISLLRSLGARKGHIISVFVIAGTILGLIGSALGVLIGFVLLKIFAGLNIGDFQNFYYLEKIPVQIDFNLIIIAFSTALLLSFVGALYPAWRATQVSPLLGLKQ